MMDPDLMKAILALGPDRCLPWALYDPMIVRWMVETWYEEGLWIDLSSG